MGNDMSFVRVMSLVGSDWMNGVALSEYGCVHHQRRGYGRHMPAIMHRRTVEDSGLPRCNISLRAFAGGLHGLV